MPLPTAEFSPFTMVNLAPSSRFKPGSIWRRQSQPCRATTSPMVKIFTCTPFLSDAGSGVIAEILYYIPVVITRMGLKFNTFATFEYSGAYMVLPVVYSFDKLCGRLRGDAASYPTSWVCKVGGFTYAFIPSVAQARQFPLQGSLRRCNRYASLVKGDSPQCGEMSRSDRGDGHRLGAVSAAD